MKIVIIGGGNMGLTYAQSFMRSHITDSSQMTILVRSDEKKIHLEGLKLAVITTNPSECIPNADLIILAVKPQDVSVLFEQISPLMHNQHVVLSIMAGITIDTIRKSLTISKVIRVMPNLPAQIGMGMSAFTSTDEVTRMELVIIQNLLNTTGKTIYVEKENLINAATAVSGSGPAYVYFFMEAMIQSALQFGFSSSEAELLVSQTFKGALDVYSSENLSCKEWIQKVASKGGTTEAALEVFKNKELFDSIKEGVLAANTRAVELGKDLMC
jgi:pyrroline-5-carboxylate reductase